MTFWIEFSTVVAETILFFYFFSLYFHDERPLLPKIIVALLYGILLFCSSFFLSYSLLRTAINFALTFLAVKYFSGLPWHRAIFPTLLYLVSTVLADTLCSIFSSAAGIPTEKILASGPERIVFNSAATLLMLVFLVLILAFMRRHNAGRFFTHSLPLLLCLVLSISVVYNSILPGSGNTASVFEALVLLYINVILCAYIELLDLSYIRKQEMMLAKQQMESREIYLHDMTARQEETRSLWHDIKKYMTAMEALVGQDQTEEANQCLQALQQSFSRIENTIDTGNRTLDCILTCGMKRSDDAGITTELHVWVDSAFQISAESLFIIIGNTWDNAVEACTVLSDTPDRKVSITIQQKNHILLYEISNPFSDTPKQKNGIHGYGLKNVRSCVEKNGGTMSVESENNTFTVTICLNI